jgi:hypothetical protein
MDLATTAARVAAYVARWGQPLAVTRPGALGSAPTVHTLNGLAQPLSQIQAERMQLEGTLNADAPYPTWFAFPGGADVREDDLIAWQGFQYRIVHAPAHAVAGVALLIKAVGVREVELP